MSRRPKKKKSAERGKQLQKKDNRPIEQTKDFLYDRPEFRLAGTKERKKVSTIAAQKQVKEQADGKIESGEELGTLLHAELA